jgi:hypothetical protein
MDKLTYKQLQALAKKQGIPANLGKAALIAKLSASDSEGKVDNNDQQMEVEEPNQVNIHNPTFLHCIFILLCVSMANISCCLCSWL